MQGPQVTDRDSTSSSGGLCGRCSCKPTALALLGRTTQEGSGPQALTGPGVRSRQVVPGWGQGRGPALEQVWEPRPPCRKTGCHCAGLQLCFPKARVSEPHLSHCYPPHHAGHTWWTTFNQLPLATSCPELAISQQKGKSRRLGFQNTICPCNGLYTHENKLRESPHCL